MTEETNQTPEEGAAGQHQIYRCGSCGAKMEYQPGTGNQRCAYCGFENAIAPAAGKTVAEQDFRHALSQLEEREELNETLTITCPQCAAEVITAPDVVAQKCAFCGSDIVATAVSKKQIKPQALLPFKIERKQGQVLFRQWITKLWFLPGDLKKQEGLEERLRGVYVPYWTYDSDTTTRYDGLRGVHYWETQHYTARENGRTVHKTRQVRKTRWYPASGTVRHFFDDVLVLASRSLPRKYTEKLEPWDTENLLPYQGDYLSGFLAESYQVDLKGGFEIACEAMKSTIRMLVCQDIGGDEQQIHSMQTRHDKVAYKHILLPVWISAYRFRERVFRFLINGRTGEVQGERPWSGWKIAFLVLSILAAIGSGVGIFAYVQHMNKAY